MTRRQFVALTMAYQAIIQAHYQDASPETLRRIGKVTRWLSREWPMWLEECDGMWCNLGKNVPTLPELDD